MLRTLKNSKEFYSVFSDCKKIKTQYFSLFASNFETTEMGIGLIASKKVGNAVKRNKIRRRMKEIIRLSKKINKHIVIVFYKTATDAEYRDLEKEYLKCLSAL